MRKTKDLLRPLDDLEPPALWPEATTRTAGELPSEPSRSARLAVVLVSAAVAAAGIVLVIRAFGGPETRPAADVSNGKIAVAREGCGGDVSMCREPARIVLVNPDGSGESEIGEGSTPAWSPDGSYLAYTAGDASAIYVVDADGTNRRAVVRCDEPDCVSVMSPSWSPDGSQLAYTAEHPGRSEDHPDVDIWVVNADGTDPHAITACRRPDCSSDFAPAWSPLGDEIAMWSMVRCGDGWGPSLRLLDLSTGDIPNVVSCVASNGSRIAWSPDGRFLAFELNTGGGTGNIFTIPAAGGSSTQVTSCDGTDCRWAYYPSWSPDGRWLLFAVKSVPEAPFEAAKARPDGSEFQRLGIQGFMPTWQPVPASSEDIYPSPTVTDESVVPDVIGDVRLPDGFSAARLAVGEGAVWALASSGEGASSALVRVDPTTDRVIATTPLEGEPWYVAAGVGAVWIGSPNASTVQRVDPATNEVTARIELPGDGVSAIAADAQAVWVEVIQNRSDQGKQNLASLLRLDPATNEVVATIPLEGLSGYDDEIAIGAGAVWVAGVTLTGPSEERGADLVRIDPTTNTIAGVVPVSAFSVRAGADAVWVTTPADGVNDSLHKPEAWVAQEIDPATNEVASPIQLPGNVSAVLAATADGVWFAGYDDQGLIHPVRWRNGAFDRSVRPIDSVYTDMTFDDGSGTIWIAAVSGLKRIDLA
jgi:Tol biopolymer transport system component